MSRVPALLQGPPWSSIDDGSGSLIHVQRQAGMQFPVLAGELERRRVRCYDEEEKDVGFFYAGAFGHSPPKCIYGLTVYLYPATEPVPRHLEAVRAEIVRANRDARGTERIVNLDQEHGGTGAHAGFLNDLNGVEAFEGVSVFERAGWFIKYRTTIGPADNPDCEQRVRSAVGAMQILER